MNINKKSGATLRALRDELKVGEPHIDSTICIDAKISPSTLRNIFNDIETVQGVYWARAERTILKLHAGLKASA